MVTVIARYRAREDAGDAVASILRRHVAATRAEPGCIRFEAFRSREKPEEFTLYERYRDEAAFDAHRASDHFAANVLQGIVPLLLERSWARCDELTPAG